MKKINRTANRYLLYHVISEPGDMTRYDYFVYQNVDDYSFMPCESDFRFPQKLNYWEVKDIDDDILIKIASKESCNPSTLRECIDTIQKLQEK